MMKPSTSLHTTYTDLCLFYSGVQCTVLPARSYREMDMYFDYDWGCEDAVERACCCVGFELLYIISSLKTQSSTLEVSDVLVHSHFFWQSYTTSPKKEKKEKRKIKFGFTMTSDHKMRKKVESVLSSSNTSFYRFYVIIFFNDSFCNPLRTQHTDTNTVTTQA